MDDDLADELVAVTSIFPECVFRDGGGDAARNIKIYPLAYPSRKRGSLVLSIPPDYPNASPTLVASVGISLSDARELLQSVWAPGQVCLYPFIETLRDTFAAELPEDDKKDAAESIPAHPTSAGISSDQDNEDLQKYQFATSSAIVDRKSVFVGRAIEVHSRAEAVSRLRWLKEHDKKVSRATHNIVAWRFIEKGVLVKDNDDDGEDAAGARIAHLLEIMDLKNVMVVVSRWYGGVLLHGDRFKHISNAAREALDVGGFLAYNQEPKGVKRKSKKA